MSASVETRMKKSNVSFTATFVGLSGYPSNVGNYTCSPVVELEERFWSVRIYPGGLDEDSRGFLSCFLSFESRGHARASFKLSVINQKGWKNHQYVSESVKYFSNSLESSDSSFWGDSKFIARNDLKNSSNGICVEDTLIIRVDLTIYGDIEQHIKSTTTVGHFQVGSPGKVKTLTEELSQLFVNHAGTDVTIVAGGSTEDMNGTTTRELIPAHKFMLSLRSEVFRAMFSGSMLEASTNEVHISDFEPQIVREFLHFVYTDQCSNRVLEQCAEKLLAIACKYQVDGLEALCENYLCANLTVQNVVKILCLADLYNARHLKSRALAFISQNAKSVVQTEGFFDQLGFSLCQEVMLALVSMNDVSSNAHLAIDRSNSNFNTTGGVNNLSIEISNA